MVNILDYANRSIALLASQFQIANPNGSLTNFQKLISAFATESQSINTQEQNLLINRFLATAQGVQLDGLGQILGLARESGQPDDADIIDGEYRQGYREDLQFQIFVDNSGATPEEVIYILKYLNEATDVWYYEIYPASFQMATNGFTFPPDRSDLVGAIQSCSPAGVEFSALIATYNTIPFSFSSDPLLEQFFVNPNPLNYSQINPFQANPGSGPEDFYVQKGETINPDFGGGFAEAYYNGFVDSTNAGRLTESIQQ